MKSKEIDILDILLILAKHKKFIIITVLIVSIAAVIYSFLATEYWVSTATILPYQEKNSNISLASSFVGGLGASLLSDGRTESIELIIIMHSRHFSEDIIKKFNLFEYFEIDDTDSLIIWDKAINSLNESMIRINLNDEIGAINISVKSQNKYLSAEIANYYSEKIDVYNRETRMTKGKQNRLFIEKRIKEVKTYLDSLTNELNIFQKENNTIQLEEQMKSLIKIYSELISEKIKVEIELDYSQKNFDDNSHIIKNLINKKAIFEDKIKSFEESSLNLNPRYILSLDLISDLGLKLAQMNLNIDIQRKVFEFLYPQYESAKIEEMRDLPTIEIIDYAYPAGLRVSPKRARICVVAFIISLFISSLIVLIKVFLEKEQKIKIKQLIKILNPFSN